MPTELARSCDRQSEENSMELPLRYSGYKESTQEGLRGNQWRHNHGRGRSQQSVCLLTEDVAAQRGRAPTAIPKSGMRAIRLYLVGDVVGNCRWSAGIGLLFPRVNRCVTSPCNWGCVIDLIVIDELVCAVSDSNSALPGVENQIA